MKSTQAPKCEAVVTGDPLEMGIAQGASLREKIRRARSVLDQLEAFRLMKPAWMPFVLFRRICQRRAAGALGRAFGRDFPDARRRLEGISKGSGVSMDALYLFVAIEAMLSEKAGTVPPFGACSAMAVRKTRSATGEPIIVRNFDYIELVQPLYTIRKSQPRRGLRSLDFTMAPFAGTVDGVNEKGLCITYNYAYATDTPTQPSVPISVVIADALQHCGTTSEAASWIQSRPRWGGGILMLADADGEIASLELSSTRSELRTARPDEDVLFHTNTFWTESMRRVQMPDNAVYTAQAPRFLRGRPLHESAVTRRDRFRKLLEANEPMDLVRLEKIMSDHGDDNKPGEKTICVHSPYWSTTASLQLFPKSRRMRVAFDAACCANHQELVL